MTECKCGHIVMEFKDELFHYQTKKGDELSQKCKSCDCKKAELAQEKNTNQEAQK